MQCRNVRYTFLRASTKAILFSRGVRLCLDVFCALCCSCIEADHGVVSSCRGQRALWSANLLYIHAPFCLLLRACLVCTAGSSGVGSAFLLNLLNDAGRTVVSSIIRQRGTLYPPATAPLKDICSNYSSLRGCDKWQLGSIMLLVFRCIVRDITSLVFLKIRVCA